MKELKINVPKGYEIDKDKSTFENIVFKEINKLPSSWGEMCQIDGYYVVSNSCNFGVVYVEEAYFDTNPALFKTKEQAEASIALAQLSQLRDVYRQGWEPDWSDIYSKKYCIDFFDEEIKIYDYRNTNLFLSFQDEETAELFLKNFRYLIEKAKPLMS